MLLTYGLLGALGVFYCAVIAVWGGPWPRASRAASPSSCVAGRPSADG